MCAGVVPARQCFPPVLLYRSSGINPGKIGGRQNYGPGDFATGFVYAICQHTVAACAGAQPGYPLGMARPDIARECWSLFCGLNGSIGTGGYADAVAIAFPLVYNGFTVYQAYGLLRAGFDALLRAFAEGVINSYFHGMSFSLLWECISPDIVKKILHGLSHMGRRYLKCRARARIGKEYDRIVINHK